MRITGMRIDLRRAIPARGYPLMVGVIALVLTISMTIPFASILIASLFYCAVIDGKR
jgi:hypothetical protein